MKQRPITPTMIEAIRITRRDGQIFGLTTHDRDLICDNVLYRAKGSFETKKGLDQRNDLKVKGIEIDGVLSIEILNENDIRAGLFDHAEILFGLCDWQSPEDGLLILRRGWLGEVVISGEKFTTELRGLSDVLQKRIGDIVTPECGHRFGDARCKIDRAIFETTGIVTATNDAASFYDTMRTEAEATFAQGALTWLTGANAGYSSDIRGYDAAQKIISLWLAPPHPIVAGDNFKLTTGCDKRFSTCREKFSNAANFGGFPHLPGQGRILGTP